MIPVCRSLLVAVWLAGLMAGATACSKAPPLMVWVDGFAPEHVSFEVEDLGPLDDGGIAARRKAGGIDGVMRLAPGSCPGPCRVAQVTIFVANRTTSPEAPPVVRLDAPAGRARRLPIAFGGARIDPGRTGRVRWLVELWPDETRLTATLSSSVHFDVSAPAPPPQVGNTPTSN